MTKTIKIKIGRWKKEISHILHKNRNNLKKDFNCKILFNRKKTFFIFKKEINKETYKNKNSKDKMYLYRINEE